MDRESLEYREVAKITAYQLLEEMLFHPVSLSTVTFEPLAIRLTDGVVKEDLLESRIAVVF